MDEQAYRIMVELTSNGCMKVLEDLVNQLLFYFL